MFSRRWLVNCLLLLATGLIVLIGLYFDDNAEQVAEPAVPGLDAASIERVEIRMAAAALSLRRLDGNWTIQDPIRWPANPTAVGKLIGITRMKDLEPIEFANIDLARLGLDPPSAEVRLGEITLRFGITNNIGGRRYTMIGERLFLLPDLQLPFISQGLAGFVDRRLLPPDLGLSALTLPGLELQRDAENRWHAAGRTDLGTERLAGVIADWRGHEAHRVDNYDGSGTARLRIAATLDDGTRHELLLLSTEPEIEIANPGLGLRYYFASSLYDRLITPAEDD